MKTILSVLFCLTSVVFGQRIETFNGHNVQYNTNGKNFPTEKLKSVLQENWFKFGKLELQSKVDEAGIPAELLWKITGSLEDVKKIPETKSSWIWSDGKPSCVEITFQSSGSGEIRFFQNSTLIGKIRCFTSNKREDKEFTQLQAGDYSIKEKEKTRESQEGILKGTILHNAISLGSRGVYVHKGELSPSHACVRIGEESSNNTFDWIPEGIPVKVVWK